MNSSKDVIVTMSDVRTAKMCSKGARLFLSRHGFSWSDFLKEGLPASELAKTGDEMALKVIKVAQDGRK